MKDGINLWWPITRDYLFI